MDDSKNEIAFYVGVQQLLEQELRRLQRVRLEYSTGPGADGLMMVVGTEELQHAIEYCKARAEPQPAVGERTIEQVVGELRRAREAVQAVQDELWQLVDKQYRPTDPGFPGDIRNMYPRVGGTHIALQFQYYALPESRWYLQSVEDGA